MHLRSLSFFPSHPSPRDSVAVIAGVQRIDGPLQVKYWSCPDPCDPFGVDAYAYSQCFQPVIFG